MNTKDATMNHCKTCKHWTPVQEKYPGAFKSPDVNAGGICGSPKLVEDYSGTHEADMLVYSYPEGGEFWTGIDFGCVHHEASDPKA